MFIIIVVMLVIVCALAFAYRRSKSNVQRNATTISLTPSDQEPPPAYKPDDLPSYSLPIFTIANNADSLHGRYVNAEDKESPPTYEEAIVIGPNVNVVSRRE